MAGTTDAALDAASERGRKMLQSEPRARTAHYDRAAEKVVIELGNDCTYAFPTALVQDLQGASYDDLAGVKVRGLGFDLHWPSLDVDLYVPALIGGIFGTREWMSRELARIAGQATSPAKAAAARSNGAKGGRPRKIAGR